MSVTNILSAATRAFKQTFTEMCMNSAECFDTVDESSFKKMTSLLMSAAQNAGKAGLEQYLKDNDTVCAKIEKNSAVYRFKGYCTNELLTLFGTISVNRSMYYDEVNGGAYHFPIDTALGLETDDFATLETREMLLFASSSNTPGEVEELLKKCSLCQPSRTAIQNIINRDGDLMESLREKIASNVLNKCTIPPETKAMVVSLDGVNVLLREKGKKKGRKNKKPTAGTIEESSPTSYHNAMVGSVSFYGTDAEEMHKRLSSVYNARMPEDKSVKFKADFELMVREFETKLHTNDKDSIPKILLTDGHLMIKGFAKDSKILQPYEKCLDFYHATEHLAKAADVMYGENTGFSKAYYDKWRLKLKSDPNAPGSIARSLASFLDRNQLSAKRAKELKTECTFFMKNKKLMKYYDFIQRGLPIGSGPIEAAAKTLVKQRMCRSGMSWSRVKGQFVLSVRTYVKSGLWDKVWEEYKTLKRAA
jgi:hypothetical protein